MLAHMSFREKASLLFAMIVMFFLIAQEHGKFFGLTDLAMAFLCVIAYVPLAYKIVWSAFMGVIKTHRLNEETLMVIATFGAFGIHDYAEALAVMVFFMIGDAFEQYAQGRSKNEITSLIKLKPQSARVIHDDGTEELLKPRKVKVGQVIRVLAGEAIEEKNTSAPGNGAAIGGLKVVTKNGWFAARPSGTENVYKIYMESFKSEEHLKQIETEAQEIVNAALKKAGV